MHKQLVINFTRRILNNTKSFHSFANACRSSNRISQLYIDGSLCDDPARIKEEVLQHFQKIYTKNHKAEAWFSNWTGKALTAEQAALLEKPLLLAEIKDAVFSMASDKAPEPDGFSIAFFNDCWDIIQHDILDLFCKFHSNGKIPRNLNATFIRLILRRQKQVLFKISSPLV